MILKNFLLMIPVAQHVRVEVYSVADDHPEFQLMTRMIEGRNFKVYLSSIIKEYEECTVNCFSIEAHEGESVVVIPVIKH